MGLLFIFIVGVLAIIMIARWGSKTRRKEAGPEEYQIEHQNGKEKKKGVEQQNYLEAGLVTLLIKKKIITEEELLSEIELLKKIKEDY
jgi:hypothetical protein